MDAALAAGAQLVVNDLANLQTEISRYGSIDTAVGKVHAVPTGALHPFLNAIETDMLALQVLINNDPGVP
jgi:hypothetical protein